MKTILKTILIHGGLFLVTLATTTWAGSEWTIGKSIDTPGYSWSDFWSGLPYSITFLFILTVHEFGHYFTALYHRVRTTLPYYIPLPPFNFSLGTLGALIRLKERPASTLQHFDIGLAGPLAGFIAAFGILWYGFTHLPPPEYIFQIHPEYAKYGLSYANYVYSPGNMTPGTLDIFLGKNLLFSFFEKFVADPARLPNVHEVIHYPILFAGFLSLVFTSLNLLPIGQLDGGHILYGLVGFRWHRIIASSVFLVFIFFAGLGFIAPSDPHDELWYTIPLFIGFLYLCLTGLRLPFRDTITLALSIFTLQYLIVTLFPKVEGYPGWLLFAFIVGRFVGVVHPPSEIEEPLDTRRQILGWLALFIFVICITPNPLEFVAAAPKAAP
jgi:membrane-associated protease RseP (regulator of RpoE activity)